MTLFSRRCLAALAAIALGVGVGACGDDNDDAKPGTTEASGSPATRGGTLTVLSNADVDSIDPGLTYYTFGWMIANATQRTLYAYELDDGTNPVPDLAESAPQISGDGKTVTVKLRAGVRFSPPVDREVTSADVKYAIERGFTKTVPSGYAQAYFGLLVGVDDFRAGKAKEIRGISTPDDRTVVFRTTKGGPLAGALVMPLTAPVPKEYARRFDAKSPSTYGTHQVATGPYMIEGTPTGTTTGYKPTKSIVLVRNPNWDPKTDRRPAYLDRVVVQEGNSDLAVASRRILEGRGMAAGDFNPTPPVLRRYLRSKRAQFNVTQGGTGTRYVFLNTKLPPFDDINVRKAVLAGMDREALVLARGGRVAGEVATHFIPPTVAGFDEAGGKKGTGVDYLANPRGDMDVAAKYMRAAGHASGRYEGDDEVLMVDATGGIGQVAAEVAQAQLEKLGFDVKLRLVSQETLYTKHLNTPAAKVNASASVGWFRDFADAESMLKPPFYGPSILPQNNSNWPQLDDPKINAAMDAASALSDPEERARAWAAVDRMIVEQAPAVPFTWDHGIQLASANVDPAPAEYMGGYMDLTYASVS